MLDVSTQIITDVEKEIQYRYYFYCKNYSEEKIVTIKKRVDFICSRYQKTFKCGKCGKCCNNIIDMKIDEMSNIATKMNMNVDNFIKKYNLEKIKINESTDCYRLDNGSFCPFLNNKKCTVYDVRPQICKEFPFTLLLKLNLFHNIFDSINNKETFILSLCCPEFNMDKFQLLIDEEIKRIILKKEILPLNPHLYE